MPQNLKRTEIGRNDDDALGVFDVGFFGELVRCFRSQPVYLDRLEAEPDDIDDFKSEIGHKFLQRFEQPFGVGCYNREPTQLAVPSELHECRIGAFRRYACFLLKTAQEFIVPDATLEKAAS